MQKKIFSKILSTIIVLSLILSVFVPMGNIIGAAEEVKGSSYSSAFTDVDTVRPDGWKAYYSADPQNSVAFTEISDSDFANYYEDWKSGAGGYFITRSQKSGLWSNHYNNCYKNMAALTYTAREYKYFTLSVGFKFNNQNAAWPVITFNQPSTTPQIHYKTFSAITDPTYGEDPIGVHFEYEGTANISGKKVTAKRITASSTASDNGWRKAEITVTPGKFNVKVYDTDTGAGNVVVDYTGDLDESYEGGYIALMQSGLSYFRNVSITALDFYGDYIGAFTDVDTVRPDGWKGYYSADPQNSVAFTEISDSDFANYYEDWKSGAGGYFITRSQKSGLWSNHYNNCYKNMAALTYTPQKYKYFKLSVGFKFNSSSAAWPVITFNQPSTTPQIHYKTFSAITDPTYGEDPIGVHFEYEGTANISGKKVTAKRITASSTASDNGWRKAEITVTPGKFNVKVYDTDTGVGNVVVDYTGDLDESYEGGYIALMQSGLNYFRSVSIIEYPEIEIHNYNATPDGNGGIANDEVFFERVYGENVDYKELVPERAGYSFMGFYSDAEYQNKIELNSSVDRNVTIYTKWSDFADVTADGSVDVVDLVRIKKMASSVVEKTTSADLDFDGVSADGADLAVLRKKLIGSSVASNVASAAELMNDDMLYPLGRTMVLDGAVEMDHVNTGFVLKGNFEGDVKADFTTNRTGTLLNVSVDDGENKIVDLKLDGLTTLAEGLEKGEHTIEVISGTSTKYSTTPDTDKGTKAYDGTLKLNKLYYSGIPMTYESDKTSRILFLGDSITCGMGLGTDLSEGGYKESNSYYSYASVLGRMLNAEVEVNARCGAKVCHFVWADCNASNNEGRGKGLCNGIDWLKSINVRNSTEYDYANNQPDIVVINLGTNDIPYAKDENGNWVEIWDDTGSKYSDEVPPLLNRVHNLYPNAKIVWTVGMMDRNTEISQEYIGYFKSYVEAWSAENGNAAYFLDLSSVADISGHIGHPTISGHTAAAEELYNFILDNNIGINVSNLAELDSVQKKN